MLTSNGVISVPEITVYALPFIPDFILSIGIIGDDGLNV
jgi:hypothetical protein